MNKVRSLRNIGWKHLAFDEAQVKEIPLLAFIKSVQDSYLPYVEEQKKVIEYAEYQRAEELQQQKNLRAMADFDIEAINDVFFGKDDEIEDEVVGQKKKKIGEFEMPVMPMY